MRVVNSVGLGLILAQAASYAHAQQLPTNIIVTGEKVDRSLQETTASVAAVDAAQIEQRGLVDLSDLMSRTANVSPVYGAAGFSIRGIANIGVSGAGEAATATVYLDEAPLASTYLQAAPTRLWDVSQVEIWRGPQSTLRSLNSLAGTIIIRKADPDIEHWDMRARAILTDENARSLAVAGGGPIKTGELGFRLAAEVQGRDGFIRNITRREGEDEAESSMLRAKLLWSPDKIEDLTLKLGYTRFRRDGGFYRVYARTDVQGFPDRRIATDDTPNRTNLHFDSINLSGQVALSPRLTLLNETTWSHARERSSFDIDYGPTPANFGAQQRTYTTFTQELRLQFDGERFSGVAGLYYYNRDLASATQSLTDVATPTTTIAGLLQSQGFSGAQAAGIASAYAGALPFITIDFDGSFPTHVKSRAVFADARYSLTGQLKLLAGFRFDRETTRSRVVQQSLFAGTYPNPASFGPFAPVIAQINVAVGSFVNQASAALPAGKQSFSAFLPKAGLLMDWNDDLATSFVVQRGYRSGGLSTNIARAQGFAYDPEYTWNYQLSLRALALDGRLRIDANAFYTDWEDQQVSVNFGLNAFDIHTVNAGRSHLYGFEVEASHQLTREWSLYGALGHTITKFDSFSLSQPGVTANLAGTEFAYAPHWTVSGGTDVRMDNGVRMALNARYASRAFASVGPVQALNRVAPHVIVNARIGYQAERWGIFATADNLFDKVYVVYKSPTETRAILNDPRTMGIEFSMRL